MPDSPDWTKAVATFNQTQELFSLAVGSPMPSDNTVDISAWASIDVVCFVNSVTKPSCNAIEFIWSDDSGVSGYDVFTFYNSNGVAFPGGLYLSLPCKGLFVEIRVTAQNVGSTQSLVVSGSTRVLQESEISNIGPTVPGCLLDVTPTIAGAGVVSEYFGPTNKQIDWMEYATSTAFGAFLYATKYTPSQGFVQNLLDIISSVASTPVRHQGLILPRCAFQINIFNNVGTAGSPNVQVWGG